MNYILKTSFLIAFCITFSHNITSYVFNGPTRFKSHSKELFGGKVTLILLGFWNILSIFVVFLLVGAMEDNVLSLIAFDPWKNELAILLRNVQNKRGFDVAVN